MSNWLGHDVKLSTDKNRYVHTENYEDALDVFRVTIALWKNELTRDCKNLKYKTEESNQKGCYVNEKVARSAGFEKSTNVPEMSNFNPVEVP